MVADAHEAGLRSAQLEGSGPAGQDALTLGCYRKGEPPDYTSARYINAVRPEQVNHYYRSIANRSFPMLPVKYVLWTYECPPRTGHLPGPAGAGPPGERRLGGGGGPDGRTSAERFHG